MPALLSSPVQVPDDQSGKAIAADPAAQSCLADWLSRVPDTRSGLGRWHPLTFVLGLAVCAMTAIGVDSVTAIGEWAADCSQQTLQALGGRRDPFRRRYRAPSIRTFGRVLAGIDIEAFNAAAYGFLHEWAGRAGQADPASPLLDEITQAEREQRRAIARARAAAGQPGPADRQEPALLPAVAGDGKVARGAVRPDGTRVNLLSVMDTATGTTLTQREIPAKTNEIPELAPAIAHLDLAGKVVTLDALHTQAETARHLAEDKHAHYLLIVKGNQPTLHATIAGLLTGPDTDFPTDITDDRGHGRRERRTVRTAPADGIGFPHAGQVFRIRRDRGELHGPWTSKEIVYGITDLGPDQAGPTQIGIYARQHWGIENRTHYVRDVTFGEDASQVKTANLPHALATIRNLVASTFRLTGRVNTARSRRHHSRDDHRILDLYGFRHPATP